MAAACPRAGVASASMSGNTFVPACFAGLNPSATDGFSIFLGRRPEHSGNLPALAMCLAICSAKLVQESGQLTRPVACFHRLTEENSVLQFRPHSGAEVSRNHTSTKVQNAITAMHPDKTILTSSLSASLNHLRICALPESRRMVRLLAGCWVKFL
jgi:hypothetical protein